MKSTVKCFRRGCSPARRFLFVEFRHCQHEIIIGDRTSPVSNSDHSCFNTGCLQFSPAVSFCFVDDTLNVDSFGRHAGCVEFQNSLSSFFIGARDGDNSVKRPGRRSAASRMSGRLVAAMIFTSSSASNPSNSARSCIKVR